MLIFLIFLNNITNVILEIMEKRSVLLSNIVTIQLYNRYIYSKTKIQQVQIRQRKLVFSYVCKTETTHASITSS